MKAVSIENSPGEYCIFCPACGSAHKFDKRWTFNGDFEKPTFQPSMLVTTGLHPNPPGICHSFVTDGKIQYLTDCTHSMAGQTVELPNF